MTETPPTYSTDLSGIHRNEQRQRANEDVLNITNLVAAHFACLRKEQVNMPELYAAQLAGNLQSELLGMLKRDREGQR